MATFNEIKAIRLVINDPSGLVNIDQCSDEAHLPATPAPQTAYQSILSGRYWITESATPGVDDWTNPSLYLSDATIEDLFDDYGNDEAIYRSLRLISAKLGSELRLVALSSGTESSTYTALRDLYQYYHDLMNDFKIQASQNTNTAAGKYGKIVAPEIAGGNL